MSKLSSIILTAAGSSFILMGATCDQNTDRVIDRPNTTTLYRIVAYGDSIYAGYYGQLTHVAKRSAPYVAGEYLAKTWNADVEVIRRTRSGATADDIYYNKVLNEAGFMQAANTRAVMLDMCGNDYLQARNALAGQGGSCDFSGLENALSNCIEFVGLAMDAVNANAPPNALKVIMNLYYPGYSADDSSSACVDPTTGQPINKRAKFLPLLATSNWRTCNLAAQKGFHCADAFAEFMAADYDRNGDGVVDADQVRWMSGESESDYVARIVAHQSLLSDAGTHFDSNQMTADYIQSDNTHPTYEGGNASSSTGSPRAAWAPPDFSDASIVGGKNPDWNVYGHERLGWAHQ